MSAADAYPRPMEVIAHIRSKLEPMVAEGGVQGTYARLMLAIVPAWVYALFREWDRAGEAGVSSVSHAAAVALADMVLSTGNMMFEGEGALPTWRDELVFVLDEMLAARLSRAQAETVGHA
jgi:hypothetical protein